MRYVVSKIADHSSRAVFAPSNSEIVGSNLTPMDICENLFCVSVVLCVGSGLATG
jgi:hypothetical protein